MAQSTARPGIPNLSGRILTVNGPIDPATAGPTLMHEHIFIDFKAPSTASGEGVVLPQDRSARGPEPKQPQDSTPRRWARGVPGWARLDNYDESLAEIMEFKRAGGGTIVDVTNFGLTRNPEWLKRISNASGLHVVMGAGWYQKALHPGDMTERTVAELTDIIVRDITQGAQGTGIRSGIIGEIGVQGRPLTANEIKSIRASARASRLTGAPMSFHMGGGTPEEKQRTMDIVVEEGVDLNHVVMGHNGSGDVEAMKRITDRGAYIEFDYIGDAPQEPDNGASLRLMAERRAQQMKALIDVGLTDRILVAHDVCTQSQLKKNEGGGFAFTSTLLIPALRNLGVTDDIIRRIMIDNPRRVLTFVAPQPPLAHQTRSELAR
ncbi:MAG: aryldialkylphosphatase [Gemmatimonadaceae bacterium]|nr:aryldialkylphosphatase [Gemmatimonadaceae bacterium]